MTYTKIFERLKEFADFMDNLEPSKEKGKLGKFFTGYNECFNELTKYKELYERYRK